MFRSLKIFAVVLVVMAFATAAYAFASSNTVSSKSANNKHAVTNVTYTFNSANPSVITYVDFDISPATTKASVSLITGTALTDCGNLTAGGTHAHCPVNVPVQSADMLRVAASN
jgi:hypothetical protein